NIRISIAKHQLTSQQPILQSLGQLRQVQQQTRRRRLQRHVSRIALVDLQLNVYRLGAPQAGTDVTAVWPIERFCYLPPHVSCDPRSKDLALFHSGSRHPDLICQLALRRCNNTGGIALLGRISGDFPTQIEVRLSSGLQVQRGLSIRGAIRGRTLGNDRHRRATQNQGPHCHSSSLSHKERHHPASATALTVCLAASSAVSSTTFL